MNREEQERRGFFRIDDNVALSYRLVPPGTTSRENSPLRVDEGELLSLGNELERMREVSRILLRHVEKDLPDVARYLAHLESKIDLLAQHIVMDSDELFVKSTQAVNISGSGIAFTADESLNVGDFIELRFVLMPSLANIKTHSKVVSCQPDNGKFSVAVEFEYLSDDDRDLLIRHVVKKQMNDIREHKTSL